MSTRSNTVKTFMTKTLTTKTLEVTAIEAGDMGRGERVTLGRRPGTVVEFWARAGTHRIGDHVAVTLEGSRPQPTDQ